jgi:Tfp pilus assembly protein PilF
MCDGGYEPARKALERLGAALVERPPQTEAEREAARLLGLAMQSVRRGDYQAAEADLGRARELAPRAPAVYQVIANVAYLQGDPRRAIEALEIAIELEPDNPLFLHNLERLRRAVE